ncbi:MAG: HAD-IIIA family hydrolase [Lysobacteraceae bacterium]|nr:MAG: HAD-IIIA family hydrolase [Xanthomonadaceae bacterium]
MMLFANGTLGWRRTSAKVEAAQPARRQPQERAAVFVDLDGTLIDGMPRNADPAQLRLRRGAAEALAELARRGFMLLVATNQSGLARGYCTRAEFARLQAGLEQLLRDTARVELLDFLVCPHAPGPEGVPSCLCRKPAPGLMLRAARQHRLDLARSWMVGDGLEDVEAGHRAGCCTVLLSGGAPVEGQLTPLRRPDARCDTWAEAVRHIAVTSGAIASLP